MGTKVNFRHRPENITLSFYRTTCDGKPSRSLRQFWSALSRKGQNVANITGASAERPRRTWMQKSEEQGGIPTSLLAVSNLCRNSLIEAVATTQKVKPLVQRMFLAAPGVFLLIALLQGNQ